MAHIDGESLHGVIRALWSVFGTHDTYVYIDNVGRRYSFSVASMGASRNRSPTSVTIDCPCSSMSSNSFLLRAVLLEEGVPSYTINSLRKRSYAVGPCSFLLFLSPS